MTILDKGMGENKRKLYPWFAALIGLFCVMTTIWSLFYPTLQAQFGMEAVTPFATGASFCGFGNLVLAPLIGGPLLDKYGPKVNLGLGVLFLIIAIILMEVLGGQVDWSVGQIYWYTGSFFAGLGIGMYAATSNAISAKWNPDRVGAAIGIATIGPAIGPLWCSPAATLLIPKIGFGNAFAVMLGIGIIGMLIFGLIPFRLPDKGWKPIKIGAAAREAAAEAEANKENKPAPKQADLTPDLELGDIVRKPVFWVMILVIFINSVGYFLFVMNLFPMIKEGLGSTTAPAVIATTVATAMSLTAICNAISRPIWGKVMDVLHSPWNTLKILYIGNIVAIIIFMFIFGSPIGAIIGACLFYFFAGGCSPVHSAIAPFLFGAKNAGKTVGATLFALGLAWIVGPIIGSAIKDATGSYTGAFIFSIIIVAIDLILVFILAAYAKKQKEKEAANA